MTNMPFAVRRHLSALRILVLLSVITGVIYPLAVTGIAQGIFPGQANGSEVRHRDKVVGSSLIGQNFSLPKRNPDDSDEEPRPDPKWFQPRPSAGDYDPKASGASNLGPNDEELLKTVHETRKDVAAFDDVSPDNVPVDAVTSSGSGLDPHISRTYAEQQAARVAKARDLPAGTVRKLVAQHVQGRILGFLGQERVNVVQLNRALADRAR